MKYNFDAAELTKEKSLWDVYRLSRSILPNTFQVVSVVLAITILSTNALFLQPDLEILLQSTRSWSDIGFSFSISTLGFLIAGFTIFATLSKPKMMLAMMEHTNLESNLPTLKYNFLTFMKVFVAYLTFSALYLIIILLGHENGFMANLISLLPNSQYIGLIVIKISYVLVGTSLIYLLLLLKSFVFNIYAIVMNFLRWEYHQD